MEKIDFSDVNKFLVSSGIVLIGLAVILPYLFLKEDFGLLIQVDKIATLQKDAQQLLSHRYFLLAIYQYLLPWIVLILFVTGSTAIISGLIRWFSRQTQIDRKFDLEIDKLEKEIETLTPNEKYKKAENEIEAIELNNAIEKTTSTYTSKITSTDGNKNEVIKYLQVEDKLIDVFKRYNSPNFDIYDNQKLGDRMHIDLLLKANSKSFFDRIVEIKYIQGPVSLKYLQDAIYMLERQTKYFRSEFKKDLVPVFIVVCDEITIEKANDFTGKLFAVFKQRPAMKRLKIEFIKTNEIDLFDVRKILKK